MYQELINEYERFSETEKNALLIYKSRLGRAINAIENDKEEITNIYLEYKKLLNDPKNIFIKMTVFQNISFETEEAFLESIKKIKEIVEQTTKKLVLKEDMTVYRIFSCPKEEAPAFLAKTNLISTSLNVEKCLPFVIQNQGNDHYFYQLHLQKGDPIAIIPYAILLNRKENQLILSKRTDQEEILIAKENYDFEVEEESESTLPNQETIHFLIVHAKAKQKEEAPKKR